MDCITIRGIEAFGRHGVLPHERELGQPFVVDVRLDIDLAPAAASDRLEDTVDYGVVAAEVVKVVTGPPLELIESVAGRIAERCLTHPHVVSVEVTVHKPNAPVPVVAAEVAVTVRRSGGGGPADVQGLADAGRHETGSSGAAETGVGGSDATSDATSGRGS